MQGSKAIKLAGNNHRSLMGNVRTRGPCLGFAVRVARISQKRGISMRKAAHILAVDKVAEATRIKGLYPCFLQFLFLWMIRIS